MSDDEVDVGMTMAMDMMEKLNEEHAETLESNLRLEKELNAIKDKMDGISEKRCVICLETKRSKFFTCRLNTSTGISLARFRHTSDNYHSDLSNGFACNECGINKNLPCCLNKFQKEQLIRIKMIVWEQKWKKLKSPFTHTLVKEWDKIMNTMCDVSCDADPSGNRELDKPKSISEVPLPCCFRGNRGSMKDYVYASLTR